MALVARAFEVAAQAPETPPRTRALVVEELARAIGAEGCCAGQAADLAADPASLALEDLEAIHAGRPALSSWPRCGEVRSREGRAKRRSRR